MLLFPCETSTDHPHLCRCFRCIVMVYFSSPILGISFFTMEFTTRMIDSVSCKSGRNRHFFILFYPDSFVKHIFFYIWLKEKIMLDRMGKRSVIMKIMLLVRKWEFGDIEVGGLGYADLNYDNVNHFERRVKYKDWNISIFFSDFKLTFLCRIELIFLEKEISNIGRKTRKYRSRRKVKAR